MKAFSELNLKESLARAIAELGYLVPTPIQAAAIPLLLEKGADLLGLAATGTGKTAAYGIPLLQRIDTSKPKVQGLILCPTRELARQIDEHITKLAKYMGIKTVAIFGGTGYAEQIQGIRRGAHIVIATPGRLIDHMEQRTINLSDVRTVVLDEADEMVSMGFKDDLEKILSQTSKDADEDCCTWLFSATMDPDLKRVAEKFMENPVTVRTNQAAMLSGTVEQMYFTLHEEEKPEAITRVIDVTDDFYGLIFCQTKVLVADLCRYLRQRGYAVEELHGDMSQSERDRAFKIFSSRKVKIMVCTDVAARGLDVKELTHVINFSLPREMESYVHRIGRTGRSGKQGIALSLVTPSHFGLVRRIEHHTQSRMNRSNIPSVADVRQAKLNGILSRVAAAKNYETIAAQLVDGWEAFLANATSREIVARMISLAYPELSSASSDAKIGVEISERRSDHQQRARGGFAMRNGGNGGGGGGGSYQRRSGPPSGGNRPSYPPHSSQRSSSGGGGAPKRDARSFKSRGSRPQ